MFATVATHRPRISRAMAGAAVSGTTMGGPVASSDPEQALTAPNAASTAMNRVSREYLCKDRSSMGRAVNMCPRESRDQAGGAPIVQNAEDAAAPDSATQELHAAQPEDLARLD